jgi:hypothetical protein
MRTERMIAVLITIWAWSSIETGKVAAQDPPQPPLPGSVIPLERTEVSTPEAVSTPPPPAPQAASTTNRRQVRPSRQAGSPGGQPPVGQLRNPFESGGGNGGTPGNRVASLQNPFEWGEKGPRRGLFGMGSPQTQPTPQGTYPGAVPSAPITGLEGAPPIATEPGAPGGAATAPSAGAIPGAEAGAAAAPFAGATTPAGDDFAAAVGGAGAGFGGGLAASAASVPGMIGDMSPFNSQSRSVALGNGHAPPFPPGQRGASLLFPTARNVKVSENQSPRPQDRIFFDFNYYNNLNSAVNSKEGVQVNHMKAYTYMWGIEKTFDNGNGSIGLRLPLDTLTADSPNNSLSTPTTSALGNLDIFAKYILKQNYETGSLISAGIQVTPSTATSRFAGAPYIASLNTTYFQPFIAYIWRRDRFFLQGFSGLDVPTNNADVTLIYNDISVGYFAYRNTESRSFLTAVVPAFEVHVNSPINHRNPFNSFDLAGTANTCNLTYGLNLMFFGRSMLTAALVTPVSSPKPFDTEVALYFNFYFGRTARNMTLITPPVVQ